ncbi:hypothetical protein CHS0354_031335 [Potamilus streckersoni]|uniref:Uncharacterized protein n=1 Tax=Potamilus streckersoni TaxID=2493646 RepID=A0AAE0TDC8_9BIVA|nr:hypothetical protein CHS0354_031335 [Potamilus streckersoni]
MGHMPIDNYIVTNNEIMTWSIFLMNKDIQELKHFGTSGAVFGLQCGGVRDFSVAAFKIPLWLCSELQCCGVQDSSVEVLPVPVWWCSRFHCGSVQDWKCSLFQCGGVQDYIVEVLTIPGWQCSGFQCDGALDV